MENLNIEQQMKLIEEDAWNIIEIENPYEDVCIEAVKRNSIILKYLPEKNKTEKVCIEAINKVENIVEYLYMLNAVDMLTENICLALVERQGSLIRYIPRENQTEKVCLKAIKNYPIGIKYLSEEKQTEELALFAVSKGGFFIEDIFPKYQTEKVCLEVIKKDYKYIKNIKKKHPKVCLYAFLNDYELINKKYVKNGIEKAVKENVKIDNVIFSNYKSSDRTFDAINTIKMNIEKKVFKFIDEIVSDEEYLVKVDMESLYYLKDYIVKENSKNKFILDDTTDIELLKEIALSDNELIIVDTGNINDIHRKLANKII